MTARPAPPSPRPAPPYVLADVGPDGAPQAMLITPSPTTVLDADAASELIADLLLVVAPRR